MQPCISVVGKAAFYDTRLQKNKSKFREISRCTALVHFCEEFIFSAPWRCCRCARRGMGAKAIFYIDSRGVAANPADAGSRRLVFQRPATRAIGARAASPCVFHKSPMRSSFARMNASLSILVPGPKTNGREWRVSGDNTPAPSSCWRRSPFDPNGTDLSPSDILPWG